MNKLILIIGISLLSIGGIFALMYVGANNKEVKLAEQITAQKQVCEAFYDKLWKIISQKAQVAEQYKNTFKEIYPQLISGRYANDSGTLMKWIQESNPTFDVSLYKDLSASIEGERAGFFMEQKKLIDLDREHKVLRKTIPSSWFVGDRPDVKFTIITSDKTEAVYKTGKENNVDVFNTK